MRRSIPGFARGMAVIALIAPPAPRATEAPAIGAAVERTVRPFLEENSVPGLSIAIVQDGAPSLSSGFGSTAPTGGSPVTAATQYRIASVTKAMTAVVVLKLAEEGKLALDDPVRSRCPELPVKNLDPTLRQLLAHQGGIRHTTDREDTTITGPIERAEDALRFFDQKKPEFAPGSSTLYSSWGYALLGCAIEHASGRPYMEVVADRVFGPAGMASTVRDAPGFSSPTFSPGFRLAGRPLGLAPSEVVDTRFKTPASGLISTVDDLARFASALLDGRLLGPASRRELFTMHPTSKGKPTDFTLGLTVGRDTAFGKAFYIAGSMEGTTSLLYLMPERKYAVIILANRERFAPEVATLVPKLNEALLGPPRR